MRRITQYLICFSALCLVVGCGQGEERGRISGTVVLDGQSVKECVLVFQKDDKSVSHNAFVKDGVFELLGHKKKGIPAGSYKVAVMPAVEQLPEYTFDPTKVENYGQVASEAKYVVDIPERYQDVDSSGILVELVEGDNQVEIKLEN